MGILGIAPETWFPIVTLIIGALLKACFDALTDKRAARRETEARREQRLDNIRFRRVETQRAALLELQNYSMKLARSTGQIHHHDFLVQRTTGAWHVKRLPDEVDTAFLEAQVGIVTRRVRVRDAEVRRLAEVVSAGCQAVALAKSENVSDQAFREVVALNEQLQEYIGVVLRQLDDDEDRSVN